ncbi:MAG: hypothetical protein K2I18_03010 [Paramuribaculum sp.]|nr:hypothetical protein [Paramuribaculum sp.]
MKRSLCLRVKANKNWHLMRWKRYGFLSAIVEGYTSIDDFVRDKSELLAVLGKELEIHDNYVIVSFYTVSDGCESYRIELANN